MHHRPCARVSILCPPDEDTIEFEARYIRHLESHRQAMNTLGLIGPDHEVLWPLAGSPVMEAVFLAADFLKRNRESSWQKPLQLDGKPGPWTLFSKHGIKRASSFH